MSLFHETQNPMLGVECPICLDPLTDKDYLAFNICDHKFHTGCLNNWQKSTESKLIHHYKCPTCDKLRDINIERSLFSSEARAIPRPTSLIKKITSCLAKLTR